MVYTGVLADGWQGQLTADDLESLRPVVRATALRVTGSESLAEDVTQESLARAVRALQHGLTVNKPRAWIRRIVVHVAIDAMKERREVLTSREGHSQCSNVDQRPIQIQETLNKLIPEHQAVLALAFGEGLSHKEIAETLDIPAGTVASRIHAAKAAFRKEWGEDND